jgi:short-subunit dehydrogenase
MRTRRAGRIVNVSSVGGRITLPYFGVYNSTKYAVESLSNALRYELHPFGVDVTLIEPGVIRTNFEATATGNLSQFASTAYGPAMAKYEEMSQKADRFAGEPISVAKAIARAVEARRPAARYVAPWFNTLAFTMAAIVPTRVWDWAIRKVARLDAKTLNLDAQPAPAVVPTAPARRAPDLHAAN